MEINQEGEFQMHLCDEEELRSRRAKGHICGADHVTRFVAADKVIVVFPGRQTCHREGYQAGAPWRLEVQRRLPAD